MSNITEFRKLVKSLPERQQARLPEKIREICNRTEHTEYLKAIAMGAYLSLTDEISLGGYVSVPEDISKDKQYCTSIRDETQDKMLVGKDEIESTMTVQEFKQKVLFG